MQNRIARVTTVASMVIVALVLTASSTLAQALPPLAAQAADMAREDLALKLEIDPATIDVLDVHPVNFQDTSLNCPKPGRLYAQVIVPGYQVMLGASGETWDYRVGGSSQPLLCGNVYTGPITVATPRDGTLELQNVADERSVAIWVRPFTRVVFQETGIAARWNDLKPGTQLYIIGNWDEFGWLIPQEIAVLP